MPLNTEGGRLIPCNGRDHLPLSAQAEGSLHTVQCACGHGYSRCSEVVHAALAVTHVSSSHGIDGHWRKLQGEKDPPSPRTWWICSPLQFDSVPIDPIGRKKYSNTRDAHQWDRWKLVETAGGKDPPVLGLVDLVPPAVSPSFHRSH